MHPFFTDDENTCHYKFAMPLSNTDIITDMDSAGVSVFCGSVLSAPITNVETMKRNNAHALKLREIFGERYIPGVHVHPAFVDESITELEAAFAAGIKLIGELVPYYDKWSYADRGIYDILSSVKRTDVTVSLHTMDHSQMEDMAAAFPNLTFVFAHPGQRSSAEKHVEIMKRRDNVYLDISGTGLERYGSLRYLCDEVGAQRILFGSDYPINNLQMYIGGVMSERLSDTERELIFAGNAKRLLGL